jgi:hypothetical protein
VPCLRAPMQCFGVTDVMAQSAVHLTHGPTVSCQTFLESSSYLTLVMTVPLSQYSNDGTVEHSLVK